MADPVYHWYEAGAGWLWHFETPLFTAKVAKSGEGWCSEVNPAYTPTYRSFFRSDEFKTLEEAIEAAEHVMIDVAEATLCGVSRC